MNEYHQWRKLHTQSRTRKALVETKDEAVDQDIKSDSYYHETILIIGYLFNILLMRL